MVSSLRPPRLGIKADIDAFLLFLDNLLVYQLQGGAIPLRHCLDPQLLLHLNAMFPLYASELDGARIVDESDSDESTVPEPNGDGVEVDEEVQFKAAATKVPLSGVQFGSLTDDQLMEVLGCHFCPAGVQTASCDEDGQFSAL